MTMMGVRDVCRVMIESRQRADQASQHRHRMGVTTEAAQEEVHLLVDHRVLGHERIKFNFLLGIRQFTIQDQITDVHEVAIDCKLFDRVTAIK